MAELITQTGVPHWLQPPKLDRSTFYPEWVWEHVLQRISAGETLTSICKDEVMPEYKRLLGWIHAEEERKNRYYLAREIGAERVEDQILDIADGLDNVMEDVQRSALRITSRKWLLGVWNRKRYGETTNLDVNVRVDLSEAMAKAQERVNGRAPVTIEGEKV